jgi:hypothetical protein
VPGTSGSGSALDQQARRLAEFFNGEVIEFDEPLEDPAPTDPGQPSGGDSPGKMSRAA